MIGAMLKRTHHYNTNYNPSRMDDEFVRITLWDLPKVGEDMRFGTDRMDEGVWRTTLVETIDFTEGSLIVKTRNSTYTIKSL